MTELFSTVSFDTRNFLLLGAKWRFYTNGFSIVNKSLVRNLRHVDPEGKSIEITCAVLQNDDGEAEDAMKHVVKLKGPERPRGVKREKMPKLKWLDGSAVKFYHHLVRDKHYDFIIGHAPYTANGCFNLKEFYMNKDMAPKVVLMFHALPKDENGYTDEDTLCDWLNEADIVFSIGKTMKDELVPYIAALDASKKPIHKMYVPSFPLEVFTAKQERNGNNTMAIQYIYVMGGEIQDLPQNSLDFSLAVIASAKASECFKQQGRFRIKLCVLIAHDQDKSKWRELFEEILCRNNLKDTVLSFQVKTVQTMESMKTHMKMSNLFLLPLKRDSETFGAETLAPIEAGVPVLISRDCGLAALLETMAENEPVVYGKRSQSIVQTWTDRIVDRLNNPGSAQRSAEKLREQLRRDSSIVGSHLELTNTLTCRENIHISVQQAEEPETEIQGATGTSEHRRIQPLTDRELSGIAQKVSAKKMIIIAIDYFHLLQVVVDNIIYDHKDDAYRQNLALLTTWKNKNPQNDRQVLNCILQSAERKGLLDYGILKGVLY